MQKHSFAIITPSYAPDFERCRLLCQSVQEFISPAVTHYIVVGQRDRKLFSQLQNRNTEIISVQSLLPSWIQRIPVVENLWFSWKTMPVRGWLLQQIVKIAVAQHLSEDVLVCIDSDVAFIRPFNLHRFVQGDQVRLYRLGPCLQPKFDLWHENSCSLLDIVGLDPAQLPNYIGQIISWKRENVMKMCEYIEGVSGRDWMETLCNSWDVSEYMLYGNFVDQILKEESGHFIDGTKICLEYWLHEPMTDRQLESFFASAQSSQIAVMIASKAKIPPNKYENLLKVVSTR